MFAYKIYSRNLLLPPHDSTRNLYIGSTEIMRLFNILPRSEHDPYSFTVDVLYHTVNNNTLVSNNKIIKWVNFSTNVLLWLWPESSGRSPTPNECWASIDTSFWSVATILIASPTNKCTFSMLWRRNRSARSKNRVFSKKREVRFSGVRWSTPSRLSQILPKTGPKCDYFLLLKKI